MNASVTPITARRGPTAIWYLLFCRPNHDAKTESLLNRGGIECYRPTFFTRRLHRRETHETSLFPRYIFARFRYSERWRVLATPGLSEINGIVMFGDEPATLTDADIDRVRELERHVRTEAERPYQRGEVVEITLGRGIRLTGTLQKHTKDGQDVIVLRRAA
jgi:transcription antitermination factor NusG